MALKIALIREGAAPPGYATENSVGVDLRTLESFSIASGGVHYVHTGLVMRPPPGTYIQIHVRSSVGIRRQCVLANGTGIIDPDYCGATDEIIVVLRNLGSGPQIFEAGERIAQAVLTPAIQAAIGVFTPDDDSRGGIGSTGTK